MQLHLPLVLSGITYLPVYGTVMCNLSNSCAATLLTTVYHIDLINLSSVQLGEVPHM